jgi:1-acyl-sn-glycerol-3-phosphate acyltransferase
MSIIRFFLRFCGVLLAFFIALPLVVIFLTVTQNNQHSQKKNVVSLWSIIICFVCGIKLKMRGTVQKSPVMVVANHVTWLDIAVIHRFKLLGYVAKKEIENWLFIGRVAKSGESLFISRGEHASRKNVIEGMIKRFSQNRSIAVFPEGRATNGNQLGTFHRQLIHAAVESKTPVQAVAIKFIKKDGTRNTEIPFKKGEKFVQNVFRILTLPTCTAELTFCDVIDTSNKTARQTALISHDQVAKVLAENDYL